MKPSLKFVCSAAVAAGVSIAAVDATRAMPVTPVEQQLRPHPFRRHGTRGIPIPSPCIKSPPHIPSGAALIGNIRGASRAADKGAHSSKACSSPASRAALAHMKINVCGSATLP